MRVFFWFFIFPHLLCVNGANSPTLAPLFSPLEPAPMSDKARGKQPVAPAPAPMSEKARGKQPIAPAPAPMSEKAKGKQPAAPAPAPMSDKAKGKQPANEPQRQPPSAPNVPQAPPTNLSQDPDVDTCMAIGDALQHLMSLGLSYEMSLEAVNRFGIDINRAVEWITEGDSRRIPVQRGPYVTGANVQLPPVRQRSDPLTPNSRGETIQQLFALGYDFSMCTEAVKRFGADIDKATNWMRELGVIPGEAPKPSWRHQIGMRYKIGDTGSKGGKAPVKPQGGARAPPEVTSPGSNESSSSSKSAGKAPMLDPKTGKPIRHDSSAEPLPRPPPSRPPPPEPVPEQEADHNTVIATAIQSLVDMGFDFDLCMTAVDQVGADVQAAASWIMDRPKRQMPPRQLGFPDFPHQLPGFQGGGAPLPPHIVQQLSGNSPARPRPQAPASPDDSHSRPITPNPPHPFPYVDPNDPSLPTTNQQTLQQVSDVPPQNLIPAVNANIQTDNAEIISPSRSSSSGSSSAETAEELDSPGTPPGLADDQDEPSGGRVPQKGGTETRVSIIRGHHLKSVFTILFLLFIILFLYIPRTKQQQEFDYIAYSEL